ncbi:hypothetical protein LO771_28825 [Streptacidiphilus sp. ASG 303]|uniref:hypothetical protein n=1 Tax=Streptacidiphilus sp. ASG 303 TaxID=2896847 RepID=UPI001E3F1B95|nr:hypothetical protein [Streptacidiphilus sp. ASG 303]MCD0486279.1 hypothetical protein [Streptacidiphilus sp. ASG 303]
MDYEWFEADDEALDIDHLAILRTLRADAPNWACRAVDTVVVEPEQKDGELRACLDVCDPINGLILLTVGACFRGSHVTAGHMHSATYELDGGPQVEELSTSGSPAELGAAAATWFRQILERPVLYREWSHAGRVAQEWSFGDSGLGLIAGGELSLPLVGEPTKTMLVRGRWRAGAGD